jgi:hypothetical protein
LLLPVYFLKSNPNCFVLLLFFYIFAVPKGEVAEWSIAAVLKTVDLQGSGGSNPPFSAENPAKVKNRRKQRCFVGFYFNRNNGEIGSISKANLST